MGALGILTEEKPTLFGLGALCIIQNFLFYDMYHEIWLMMPSDDGVCTALHSSLGISMFDCFFVTIAVFGILLGGWTDSGRVYWAFFLLHLVGGLGYTYAIINLGLKIFSDDGKACSSKGPNGLDTKLAWVWSTQLVFYVPYCCCMASIFYVGLGKQLLGTTTKALGILNEDKPVLFGLGALCIIQNFLFYDMYYGLWLMMPSADGVCATLHSGLGISALDCFFVTVAVFGIVLGGWMDSAKVYWTFFLIHLAGGLGYTYAIINLGSQMHSDDGKACYKEQTDHLSWGPKLEWVWFTQAIFYVPYCCCMASIAYVGFIKQWLGATRKDNDETQPLI